MNASNIQPPIGILKSLWTKQEDGRWGIHALKSFELKPQKGEEPTYFRYEDDLQLVSTTPPQGNMYEQLSGVGTIDHFMKQSIVPVIAWVDGDTHAKCIGTASIISCSGYLITAAHVVMDPVESGYGGKFKTGQESQSLKDNVNIGVFIHTNPVYETKGLRFFPLERWWLWGKQQESPLVHMPDTFVYDNDIAICKIAPMPHGIAHQPLNMSVNPFTVGEAAYSIGYALMDDVEIIYGEKGIGFKKFTSELIVSIGEVMNVYPENGANKELRTPGPCFDFNAKIPGKMSGSPIFGAKGAIIRGVVSGSWSGEHHAYGAMLGPIMNNALVGHEKPTSILTMMQEGIEGIPQLHGAGL